MKNSIVKIGVLTFHRALNYGAVLQAYALTKKVSELGSECEIVDYRCPYIENVYHKFSIDKIASPKRLITWLLCYPGVLKRRKAFNNFNKKYIKQSSVPYFKIEDLKKANKEYDKFITGSDQVWNPACTDFDKTYFLDFAESKKKNSYAASLAVSSLPEEQKREFKKLLSDYENLSVREKQGAGVIADAVGLKPEIVLDPTFLIEKDKWEDIAKAYMPQGEKYVLVYMLMASDSLISFAKKLAEERGAKLVMISDALKKKKGITYADSICPSEFLGLFKNAECVVTNSFHGTAFSINMHKEFYVELQPPPSVRNSRMEDLIGSLSLESRFVLNGKCSGLNENIDYEKVDVKLNELRNKSIDFLKKIIDKGEN